MQENHNDALGRKFKEKLDNYEPTFDQTHWADMQRRLENGESSGSYLLQRKQYIGTLIFMLFCIASIATWFYGNKNLGKVSKITAPNIITKNTNHHISNSLIRPPSQKNKGIDNRKIADTQKTMVNLLSNRNFGDLNKTHVTNKIDSLIPIIRKAESRKSNRVAQIPRLVPKIKIEQKKTCNPTQPNISLFYTSKSNTSKIHYGLTGSIGKLFTPPAFQHKAYYGIGLSGMYDISPKIQMYSTLTIQHIRFSKTLTKPEPDRIVYAVDPASRMFFKQFVERSSYAHTAEANWLLVEIPIGIEYKIGRKLSISAGVNNKIILRENYVYGYEIAPLDGLPVTKTNLSLKNKIYPLSGYQIGIHFKPISRLPLRCSTFANFSQRKFGKEDVQMNQLGTKITYYFK